MPQHDSNNHMRIRREEFEQKALRVHSFLVDVPLHDVWSFHLHGGGDGRTLHDFRALWSSGSVQRASPVVRTLFKLRSALGNLFEWDDEKHVAAESSYVHRLTDTDRARSLQLPGSRTIGPFCSVYAFENETLDETMNATVHAFSLMAMEPAPDGYTVYWAIYVNKVNWLTPIYMTLIDPFRRLIVYPAIIKKLEGAWTSVYG